jgi:hypothetical protein
MKSRKLKERRSYYTPSIIGGFIDTKTSKEFEEFCEDIALRNIKINQSRRGLREETEEVPW